MSPVILVASIFLCVVGIMFGSLPLILAFRGLPRWIRVALHTAGAAFIAAAGLYITLDSLGSRVSPQLHQIIFGHVVLIGGMGFGILLLLVVSGEYFKALRELDATRRKTLSDAHEEPSQHV
jgi:Trk-type K+ transport system membrane component